MYLLRHRGRTVLQVLFFAHVELFVGSSIVVFGIGEGIVQFSKRYSWFKSTFQDEDNDTQDLTIREIDANGISTFWRFWLFLQNSILCIMRYAFRYNSDRAENPGWTAVFGK